MLRSKRELIERFIQENLPVIENADDIEPAFNKFWDEEEQKAFLKIVDEEHLSAERTEKLMENYLFVEREPMRDDILDLIEGEKPSLMQRKTLGERILQRIVEFVDTFKNGMNG